MANLKATVTVDYVNPPKEGKRFGSIKSKDGVYYGVRQGQLGEFQKGGTYEIEYDEEQGRDGKIWKTVKAVKSASITSGNGGAKQIQRETSGKDAERIFVCGIVNNAVRAGKLSPDDTEAVVHVIRAGRAAWGQTFGMSDEEPY